MKKRGWGFDLRNLDLRARPQDDFYQYAIGGWLSKHAIPRHESRWGSFLILRRRTDSHLRALLEEIARKKVAQPGSAEQMIRDLYRSGMDVRARIAAGTRPIEELRAKIRDIRSRHECIPIVAALHRVGVDAFFDAEIDQDMRNAERYIPYLAQGGLGMPDRDYYLATDPEHTRVRKAYEAYLERLLALSGLPRVEAAAARQTVMRIETRLAHASMKKEDLREPEKVYHAYGRRRLGTLAPAIDWRRYFGRAYVGMRTLIVMQPRFLAEVSRMLEREPLPDLKAYLEWCLINGLAGALSTPFVRAQFSFYGTTLSGTPKMRPLWQRVLAAVNVSVGESLGQLYVERHFTPEAKRRVERIVDDLAASYEARIKALDWMTPATKARALQKLRSLNRKLGYPKRWKSYRGLVIRPDDFAGNLMRASAYEHRRMMRRLNRPVARREWFTTPQTVNAYFHPTLNDIVFPAAILQHPFFSLSADDAVNYGAMGSVIGHEMTHGFDDQGAKFDERGNLKNWWRAADQKRFRAKGRALKQQYDAFVEEGLPVNGQLTLGENIADLGGLVLAFEAYRRRLAKMGRELIGGFTPEQRFFLAYAQSEHELRRPESAKLALLTDPHAPSRFRVNGPLSNMIEFYEAFGVSKGDKLWRPPSDRAKIW